MILIADTKLKGRKRINLNEIISVKILNLQDRFSELVPYIKAISEFFGDLPQE